MKKITFLWFLIGGIVCPSCQPTDSTQAQNEQRVRQLFEHFNAHDWNSMVALYADSAQCKDPSYGPNMVKMSRQDIQSKHEELQKMAPDIRDDVVAIYPSGQHVVVEFVSSGTLPDGQKMRVPICSILTFEKGKIVQDFTYYDNQP
jgi:ketosteroid isomerase-like protein